MGQWQLQDAKARLSEVIKSAHDKGSQQVTVCGKPSAGVESLPDGKRKERLRVWLEHTLPDWR